MLKKLLTLSLALVMALCLTGCGSDSTDDTEEKQEETETEVTERPFTESDGLIKYFTIEGENIPLPETVGEYVRYLEKIGTKVELGNTGQSVDDAPELAAGGISSMVAYLKVYLGEDDSSWQWFGVRYENDTDEDLPVSDCKVTQITVDYDTILNEANHYELDSAVFITNNDAQIAMDGKTTSSDLLDYIGSPYQNTDGHWFYNDDQGYVYEMVTENKKGILTRVEITYPTE